MLSLANATAPVGFHSELQRQWRAFPAAHRPRSLWFACADPVLDGLIDRAVELEPTLVLRRALGTQANQLMLPEEESVTIDYAVRNLGVLSIVLCGHSRCSSTPPVTSRRADRRGLTTYERMVERIRSQEVANQQVRQQLRCRLMAIKRHFAEFNSDLKQVVSVDALFYLAESGALMWYDMQADQFTPLGSMSSLLGLPRKTF